VLVPANRNNKVSDTYCKNNIKKKRIDIYLLFIYLFNFFTLAMIKEEQFHDFQQTRFTIIALICVFKYRIA
jgi:hypothetical protein